MYEMNRVLNVHIEHAGWVVSMYLYLPFSYTHEYN